MKHWLVLNALKRKDEEIELLKELIEYSKRPGVEIEYYNKDSGSFDSIFSVKTEQSYNDLDLPCNSGSNSFRRLLRKPNDISKGINFNEYIEIVMK